MKLIVLCMVCVVLRVSGSELTSEERFRLRSSIEVEDINHRIKEFLNREEQFSEIYREANGMAVPGEDQSGAPVPSMTAGDFKVNVFALGFYCASMLINDDVL